MWRVFNGGAFPRCAVLQYDDGKAPQCDGGMMSAETNNTFNETSKEVTGGDSLISLYKSNKIPHSEEETTKMSAKDVNDTQKEPRLEAPLIRPRSSSPAVEINEGNKRPALICNFFAKGWCIKGNSCRFRHIKESMNANDQQKENSVAAYQKSEPQDDEGLRDGVERSGLATPVAVPTTTCSSETILLQDTKESPKHKINPKESQKEDPVNISLVDDDKETGGSRENQYLDKEHPPVNANSLLHETSSSNPFTGSDIRKSNWVSSYATSMEELDGREYQFRFHNLKVPITNYSPNYGSSSFQSTSRISPSNHSSMWPRTSTLLSSSSWNSDSFGTVKHLGGDRELHPIFRPNVTPFSGSESEHLYRDKDVLPHSAGFTTKFSSYDWEPSKPFRSSFLISQGIYSPASQYDPIRDSIEQPKDGDKISKFSSSSRTPSISSIHSLMDVNAPLKEKFGMDHGSDRLSLASHVNGHDNAMDVNSNARELGTVDTKQENTKREAKGKKHPIHAHVGDAIQSRELQVNPEFVQENDGPSKEIKIGDDSSRYRGQDFDIEGEGTRESKALKHFRAALIEFVKELVKPTWRDGKLSKDAHKVIVKKAVDKVINTLPAEHIPSMQESIDIYLSSSQPKIVKLVEGYIEKYGKL
ncbi:Zinc finger, CCCH-type [Cynara cardunculus var. scolymus]|uniref:Zinc finger, CCCH-type n=1 Tax=Cynara cardunculus var. scolymus TaxID=59895 RepID=A0A103XF25_CYNCS|nr:Zinc finger, CCCH-type [Cynara cardunculus var. scolymus]